MIRPPAVAGTFYPANSKALSALVRELTFLEPGKEKVRVQGCLVPHAGYMYSGPVAGAVFARVVIPKKILLLGVRHRPPGEPFAILSEGAWRTPLGDAPIDTELAVELRKECPALREDSVAHSREHSLEVQVPFLQLGNSEFSFVPVAIGSLDMELLTKTGEGIARAIAGSGEEILVVTSSDLNHYEDEEATRRKDAKAIEALLRLDASGLFATCRRERISMCGLGPAVILLTALNKLGTEKAELLRYATSAEVSGDRAHVVGYAGMIFSKA